MLATRSGNNSDRQGYFMAGKERNPLIGKCQILNWRIQILNAIQNIIAQSILFKQSRMLSF